MKRFLLLLALPLLCVIAAQAEEYGINVAGVEVTSSNYNNITGGNINSGTVTYSPTSRTLTLTNVKVSRTGGGNYAIHNRKVGGLTIKFVGACEFYTVGTGLKLEHNTTITVDGTSSFATFACSGTSDNQNGMNISSDKVVTINGTGKIYFSANASSGSKEAVKGGSTNTLLYLMGSVTMEAMSTSNYVLSTLKVVSYDGTKLFVAGNSSKQSLYNCTWWADNRAAILAPVGAYASNGTIYTSSGSPVKNQDILISSDYAFIINSSNFPDAKLREYLLTLYSKGYVTSSEVNSRTSLTFSGKQVSSITGIHRFTALTYLDCSTNYLTSLSTLPSNLKTLDCHSNNLSSLPTLPTALETLNCGFNQLTSLPTLPSTIKQLKIRSNKFTSLTITGKTNLTFIDVDNNEDLTSLDCHGNALTKLVISGCLKLATLNCSSNAISEMDGLINRSALTYLDVSNNRYLTELICYNNGLTTLNVSGCSAMTELYCYSNKLGNLGTLPSAIKTLNCKNNKLTSLPTLPTALEKLDCSSNQLVSLPTLPSSIQRIEAFSNKFTSLTITSRSALTYLDVHNNTSLTSLVCSGNSLTRLDVTLCPAMTTLGCSSNKLTDLGTLPTALTYLDCSKNQLTSLSTLPSTLKELYCHNNQLTWLPTLPSAIQGVWAYSNKFTTLTVNGKSALTALDVSINPNLTTLECYSNALTELSVENCPAMTSLDCHSNKVTSLNLAASSNLKTLRCYRNELTSLGVSGKTKLELINCSYNKLTSLNVSNCNSLSSIQFNNNQISGNGMTTLVNSLRTIPDGSVAYIYIYHEGDSDEGNAITDDQLATVFDKNWIPYKYTDHWEQIEKPEPTPTYKVGDVNGDGAVNGDDLNTLINILLGKDHDDHGGRDNVDGEGGVDGNDLNMLIRPSPLMVCRSK